MKDQEQAETPQYIGYTAAAEKYGFKKGTLHSWVCQQKKNPLGEVIPFKRFGPRHAMFMTANFEKWLSAFNGVTGQEFKKSAKQKKTSKA